MRIGKFQRMSSINSVVSTFEDLGWLPHPPHIGPAIYLRDIASVDDSTDIQTGYALVDGKRTVFMAHIQRPLLRMTVVEASSKNIPMKSLLPRRYQNGILC